jgi:phosphoglycerate dehydrogenase-like enzyme
MPASLVLVTEPHFTNARATFTSVTALRCAAAPAAEAELARAILASRARHVIVGPLVYEDRLYAVLPRGGVIARFGVGHDGIDKAKATRAGLLCTNTPSVVDQSVAELTLLLVGAAARQLVAIASDMRAAVWNARSGVELCGKTLAIIGYGRIGRATARIAARGFGMRVIGCRRSASTRGQYGDETDVAAVTDDFADAVREADYVSLHIPAASENRHFINRERLTMMQRHAWLINTARGAVVDEVALYDAVRDERIGGAALDVYEREPYEPLDPARDLRSLSRVILVPHVGTNTIEANRRMAERALHNVLAGEAGDFAGMDLLNPEVL